MAKYERKPLGRIAPGEVVLSPKGRMVFSGWKRNGDHTVVMGVCPDTGKPMEAAVENHSAVFCER